MDINFYDTTNLLQWQFDSAITALAANFNSVDNGGDITLTVDETGDVLNISDFLQTNFGTDNGFVGFSSDTPFTSVSFSRDTTGNCCRTFFVDDVSFGGSAAVPFEFKPGMGILLALSVFGISAAKKRRNAASKLDI